nr:MAG TPA: hypothetical protein [Caudoviricetes sp.]
MCDHAGTSIQRKFTRRMPFKRISSCARPYDHV